MRAVCEIQSISRKAYVAEFMMAIVTTTMTTTMMSMGMSMMTMMMILNIDDDGDNSDDRDTCQTDGSIEYGQNMQRLGSQQMC